jgi:hypothetical protein
LDPEVFQILDSSAVKLRIKRSRLIEDVLKLHFKEEWQRIASPASQE